MRNRKWGIRLLVTAVVLFTAVWVYISWMQGWLPQNYFPVT